MRLLLACLLGLIGLTQALSAAGSKLLVVLEEHVSERSKYSQFWLDLESRGFQLTFQSPRDTSLSLFHLGAPAYNHALILPPKSKGLGPQLTPNLLVDFIDAGSNVLLALSSENPTPSAISSLLLELDISLPPDRNSMVVDHFNYDTKSSSRQHDVLLLPSPQPLRKDAKHFFSVDGLIAFPHAVAQVLGPASQLLAPILKAPATAYTYNPKEDLPEEDLFATGSQISLVSAFQARNSARFTVLGSSESLEDKWMTADVRAPAAKIDQKTSNKAFAEQVSAWTFQELGVLKVGSIQDHLNEGSQKSGVANTSALGALDVNPGIYRIKNDVKYSIALSEWTMDHYEPFTPPAGDNVQVEFSMLSPFHRLNLNVLAATANETIYGVGFKLPDQHGIFNFLVNYKRPFLTNVFEKRTVTVRHFAHDEWPRSFVISGAYPWISGIGVTIAGWVVFVALWVYSKPVRETTNLKVEKR